MSSEGSSTTVHPGGESLEERLRRAAPVPVQPADPARYRVQARRRTIRRGVLAATGVVVGLFGVGGLAARLVERQPDSQLITTDGGPSTTNVAPSTRPSVTTEPPLVSSSTEGGSSGPGGTDNGPFTTEVSRPRPDGPAVSDGGGGWIVPRDQALVHLRLDRTDVDLALPPAPPSPVITQRFLTDVAILDGRPHLFISEFLNRSLDETDFLVTIYAIDLTTDQVAVVEQRTITEINSWAWLYNGHITSDGTRILVMRELWQGFCYFAEALDITGAIVDWPGNPIPASPDYLDRSWESLDPADPFFQNTPSECVGIDVVDDQGVQELGQSADTADLDSVERALNGALWNSGH